MHETEENRRKEEYRKWKCDSMEVQEEGPKEIEQKQVKVAAVEKSMWCLQKKTNKTGAFWSFPQIEKEEECPTNLILQRNMRGMPL